MSEKTNPVEMKGVSLRFGAGAGVFDVDLEVPVGSIFGLIGPSGCGKTTVIRLMLGLLEADSGSIFLLGHPIEAIDNGVREQFGYMPQEFALYPNLSVNENLRFVASLYGIDAFGRQQRIRDSLNLVELGNVRRRLVRDLSSGMRRRLLLAGTLLHDPDFIVVDEPTAGIDPVLRQKLWDHFRHLRENGKTLFVTTQYVEEAAYCDFVGMMNRGRLLMVDTPAALRHRAQDGEIIALTVSPEQADEAFKALSEESIIHDVERMPSTAGELHLHVSGAAKTIPAVIALSRDRGFDITAIEEYQLHFNDVFYRLLEEKVADE